MGFTRHTSILLTVVATAMLVVQCQSKIHDNASPASFGLTRHKARELAANPGALIHEALNLVRRRRSVDVAHDDPMSGINRDQIANLARKQLLQEKSSGEEREHTIDKRQIPGGLGMLNDYMGTSGLQEIVTGISSEETMNRRTKKDLHENVSEILLEIKALLTMLSSSSTVFLAFLILLYNRKRPPNKQAVSSTSIKNIKNV